MEFSLYNIIEYGGDPCVMKLVCSAWEYQIDIIDGEILERVRWRIPDKPISYIVMMLLDSFDILMTEKMICHMSIPIVDWNTISYLIENTDIARMIYSRMKNRHTREMCRRLGVPIPIPKKEIFKISSTIGGQTSTTALKSLGSIIALGYIDALEHLFNKSEQEDSSIEKEQLYTLLNASLAMLNRNETPINPCVVKWLTEKHEDCVPDNIYYMLKDRSHDVYNSEYNMMRISLDTTHPRLKLVPLVVFSQLGKNILVQMASSVVMCKNYILACSQRKMGFVANIRVIDAIIRNCSHRPTRDIAMEIAIDNGWDSYLVIASEE